MRERLIEAATSEIMAHGFSATTVDSICARAGGSKGSFYHFFPSKAAIGVAVLEIWFARVREASEGGPFQTENQPEKKLAGYLNHLKNISPNLWGKGSALAALATELGESGEELPAACRRLIHEATEREEREDLFAPVARGLEGRHGRDVALLHLAVVEGAALLARAQSQPEVAREIMDTFQLCLRKLVEYTREPE